MIPLKTNEKQACLKGWSTIHIESLQKYGKKGKATNWGIRCDNLVIVDVDAKEKCSCCCTRYASIQKQSIGNRYIHGKIQVW